MAKARITFNDGAAWTLQSDYPVDVACRFGLWLPDKMPIGDSAVVLADESIIMAATSTRYSASFEIRGLFMGPAANSSLDIAHKFKAHLIGGGVCAVMTEDVLGSTYASCGMTPGAMPEIRQTDKRTLEYAIRLNLINRAAVEMICHYK